MSTNANRPNTTTDGQIDIYALLSTHTNVRLMLIQPSGQLFN